MDEHQAPWPTQRWLLLRLGEARATAPRFQTIEARPERASGQARRRRPLPGEAAARRSIGPFRAHRSVAWIGVARAPLLLFTYAGARREPIARRRTPGPRVRQ